MGNLFPLEMTDPSHHVIRGLFLSAEMNAFLSGPWEAEDGEDRARRLRADMESFVKREPITMCLKPRAAGAATFGRLEEPEEEVWDFRSRAPKPAMRIFGRFSKPDVFIALHWRPRSKQWNGRDQLGAWGDPRWEDAKAECIAQWDALFPDLAPVHGDNIHAYVTDDNAIDILSP